jgi:predicted nucleic acid-binding protein
MSDRSFIDTNILVYTDDQDAPEKQQVALDLLARAIADGTGVVSTQVLQEYYAAATRKLGVDPAVARRKVELFSRLDTVQVGTGLILAAIDLHRLHRLSFWDALIVRAALDGGCSILYTEDLGSDQRIEGLRIFNPFPL